MGHNDLFATWDWNACLRMRTGCCCIAIAHWPYRLWRKRPISLVLSVLWVNLYGLNNQYGAPSRCLGLSPNLSCGGDPRIT
jgi:hypothetical protein